MKQSIIIRTVLLFVFLFGILALMKLQPSGPLNQFSWWLITVPLWGPLIILFLSGIALMIFSKSVPDPEENE